MITATGDAWLVDLWILFGFFIRFGPILLFVLGLMGWPGCLLGLFLYPSEDLGLATNNTTYGDLFHQSTLQTIRISNLGHPTVNNCTHGVILNVCEWCCFSKLKLQKGQKKSIKYTLRPSLIQKWSHISYDDYVFLTIILCGRNC